MKNWCPNEVRFGSLGQTNYTGFTAGHSRKNTYVYKSNALRKTSAAASTLQNQHKRYWWNNSQRSDRLQQPLVVSNLRRCRVALRLHCRAPADFCQKISTLGDLSRDEIASKRLPCYKRVSVAELRCLHSCEEPVFFSNSLLPFATRANCQ